MSNIHFDNYPSRTGKQYRFIKSIKKFLSYINVSLKWVEIVVLPSFLIFCVYFIFTQKTGCITGDCNINWLNINVGFFKLQYSDNLFNFIADYGMPFLAIDGLIRIGLTFWINKKEGNFEWLFYLGLVGFAICYYFLSLNFESFAYIHAPGNKVSEEAPVVEAILAGLIASGFLVFRDKYNWDRASFFTKFRLLFYSVHLVICVVNINFGIIFFLLSIPFQLIVDLRRRNHIHYSDPIWTQE
jgi:hypothetical protein